MLFLQQVISRVVWTPLDPLVGMGSQDPSKPTFPASESRNIAGTWQGRGKSTSHRTLSLDTAQPFQTSAVSQGASGGSVPLGPCMSKVSWPSCPADCHLHAETRVADERGCHSAANLPDICLALLSQQFGREMGHSRRPGSPPGKVPAV